MKAKLRELMDSQGLKSSRLAEKLEINPANISHILAGRNKPGFDLLQKILQHFPEVSAEWLLRDEGPMYRNSESAGTATASERMSEPRTEGPVSKPNVPHGDLFASQHVGNPNTSTSTASTSSAAASASLAGFMPKTQDRSAAVKRVVIFYDDDSFEAYFPTGR